MPIRLVPISRENFPQWVQRSVAAYETDLVATGVSPEGAQAQAESSIVAAFPEGAPSADNAVFDIVDPAGASVGYAWVGRDRSEDPSSWWVWDISIDPECRGRGYGRGGMELAEEYARTRGATTLGLSVFGFNAGARGLYESLGYETTSIKMRKTL